MKSSEYWWIKIRQGTWRDGRFEPSRQDKWGTIQVARYDKDDRRFWITGTDEYYCHFRVKMIRKIPHLREGKRRD